MLADLERLIELQQVDLRLLELLRQIKLLPQKRQQAQQELAQALAGLEAVRNAHTESLKERKRLEIDVQQFKERIEKHRAQLYEVKSNEAYRALQHEMEEEQKKMAQAEDRVLEAMIAAEEQEKAIKASETELKQVEQRVQTAIREIDAEEAARKKDAQELSAQRDQLRAGIGEEALDTYDRIARAHAGIALAEARDEICQVCLIHIRPQTFADVRRNQQIFFCESCHRILYYVPAPPKGVEQPVSTA